MVVLIGVNFEISEKASLSHVSGGLVVSSVGSLTDRSWVQFLELPSFFSREPVVLKFMTFEVSAHSEKMG